MPKKKRPRKPVRRSSPGRTPARSREPDLLDGVRSALAADEPLALLELASTLLAVVDPGRRGPLSGGDDPGTATRDALFESLLGVELPETSALLLALAALSSDELLQRRVRADVAARGHDLPGWLSALDTAEPAEALQLSHVLGDGDNVMVGLRLPGGQACTVTVYIDHNLGTLVKDAFVVPLEVRSLADRMLSAADGDPDTVVTELPAADARARVTEAIALGAITIPPFETDTWPGCRALVEWVVGTLPAGGTGYVRPEWDDQARTALADRFFGSEFGAPLQGEDARSLLESLVWFGADYGPGDPMRWSPSSVDILLLDWIPRKIVADADHLAKAPQVLRAFIRFCHAERGIRDALTGQTVQAVDELEPEYQVLIRTPRPQGPEALLAALQEYEQGQG